MTMADTDSAFDVTDEFDFYTDFQNRFLQFYPGVLAIPSWIGSGLIIFVILKERLFRTDTYNRIMLGLSVCDFVFSIQFTIFMGAWSIPEGASAYVLGASAPNHALCTVQGILLTFYMGAQSYTIALMLYFIFLLILDWNGNYIARKVEPWMHGVSLGILIPFLAIPALFGVFNPSARFPGICVEASFPIHCEEDGYDVDCERGGDNVVLLRTLLGIPALISFLILVVSMVLLVRKVCLTHARMAEYTGGQLSSSVNATMYRASVRAVLYVFTYGLYAVAVVTSSFFGPSKSPDTRGKYFATSLIFATIAENQGTLNAVIYLTPRFKELTSLGGTLSFLGPVVRFLRRSSCCVAFWTCECFSGCMAHIVRLRSDVHLSQDDWQTGSEFSKHDQDGLAFSGNTTATLQTKDTHPPMALADNATFQMDSENCVSGLELQHGGETVPSKESDDGAGLSSGSNNPLINAPFTQIPSEEDGHNLYWERHQVEIPNKRPLGIVLESMNLLDEYPVIQRVDRYSPLVGHLQVGDRVVGIDGLDTGTMTKEQFLMILTTPPSKDVQDDASDQQQHPRYFLIERRRDREPNKQEGILEMVVGDRSTEGDKAHDSSKGTKSSLLQGTSLPPNSRPTVENHQIHKEDGHGAPSENSAGGSHSDARADGNPKTGNEMIPLPVVFNDTGV